MVAYKHGEAGLVIKKKNKTLFSFDSNYDRNWLMVFVEVNIKEETNKHIFLNPKVCCLNAAKSWWGKSQSESKSLRWGVVEEASLRLENWEHWCLKQEKMDGPAQVQRTHLPLLWLRVLLVGAIDGNVHQHQWEDSAHLTNTLEANLLSNKISDTPLNTVYQRSEYLSFSVVNT